MSTPTPQGGPIQFVQFLRLFEHLGDGWLLTVVLGLFAGFVVRFGTSSKRNIGLLSTCLFGVAGAFLGVAIAGWLGIDVHGAGVRFIAAVAGSALLAMVGGMFGQKDRDPD